MADWLWGGGAKDGLGSSRNPLVLYQSLGGCVRHGWRSTLTVCKAIGTPGRVVDCVMMEASKEAFMSRGDALVHHSTSSQPRSPVEAKVLCALSQWHGLSGTSQFAVHQQMHVVMAGHTDSGCLV